MPNYWLIKSEPDVYPYAQLEKDKRTDWTGVRNYEARNNLRAMQKGDLCLYYHSNTDKAVVGIAKVLKEAGPDPTAPDEDWASVVVAPHARIAEPVTLAAIKANATVSTMNLVKKSRISVVPVSPAHFKKVLQMGKTALKT